MTITARSSKGQMLQQWWAEDYQKRQENKVISLHQRALRDNLRRGQVARLGCEALTPNWLTKWNRLARKILNTNAPQHNFVLDHIIPIAGKQVTGLTVTQNLQWLSAQDNIKKHARITQLQLDQIAAQQMWELQSKGLAQ